MLSIQFFLLCHAKMFYVFKCSWHSFWGTLINAVHDITIRITQTHTLLPSIGLSHKIKKTAQTLNTEKEQKITEKAKGNEGGRQAPPLYLVTCSCKLACFQNWWSLVAKILRCNSGPSQFISQFCYALREQSYGLAMVCGTVAPNSHCCILWLLEVSLYSYWTQSVTHWLYKPPGTCP